MSAGKLDFTIEQGTTFQRKITLTDELDVPIDLTGRTFRGQIKKVAGHGVALATFSFSLLNQLTNPGELYFSLTDVQTAAIPAAKQTAATKETVQYAYDIEMIYPTGNVERLLEGVVTISPEVTT